MQNTTTAQTATIGQGTAVHVAYFYTGKDGADRLCGSLCNPHAWQKGRVRLSDQAATCTRCAKATDRLTGARPAN